MFLYFGFFFSLFQMIMKAIQYSLLAALALKLLGVCYGCKISEYPCKGGASCVPLDKYCDGRDDCGDGSDEPKLCTGEFLFVWNCNYFKKNMRNTFDLSYLYIFNLSLARTLILFMT